MQPNSETQNIKMYFFSNVGRKMRRRRRGRRKMRRRRGGKRRRSMGCRWMDSKNSKQM